MTFKFYGSLNEKGINSLRSQLENLLENFESQNFEYWVEKASYPDVPVGTSVSIEVDSRSTKSKTPAHIYLEPEHFEVLEEEEGGLEAPRPFGGGGSESMTAKQLKKWREAMGITQKQAAELLGVHIETIKSYEIGRRPISEPIARLCNMLSESAKKSQKGNKHSLIIHAIKT